MRLKTWLKDNSIQLQAFSNQLGISRIALYNYMKGNTVPCLLVAMKIRKLTGLKFSEILQGKDDEYAKWQEFMQEIDDEIHNKLL